MASTIKALFQFLFLIANLLPGVVSYERCSAFKYCEDDYYCCEYDTKCCHEDLLAVGAIIGIVIGCIVFVSCVVAVICCLTKQGHRQGQVIQPVQPAGVTVISAGHGYSQPAYGQQPMYGHPPAYGHQPFAQQQFGTHQPPSGDIAGTSDPAYPPAPANY